MEPLKGILHDALLFLLFKCDHIEPRFAPWVKTKYRNFRKNLLKQMNEIYFAIDLHERNAFKLIILHKSVTFCLSKHFPSFSFTFRHDFLVLQAAEILKCTIHRRFNI